MEESQPSRGTALWLFTSRQFLLTFSLYFLFTRSAGWGKEQLVHFLEDRVQWYQEMQLATRHSSYCYYNYLQEKV